MLNINAIWGLIILFGTRFKLFVCVNQMKLL